VIHLVSVVLLTGLGMPLIGTWGCVQLARL
jgi:hypothetical protein